ncbi:Protein PHLOEM PROTEIN 2-LIKE A9 [Glycine soja]
MPFKKPHHTSDKNYITGATYIIRDDSNIQDDGGKFEIQPRGLNIVWGNDSRYWKIPEQGPAELIQVSWLEVSGVVNLPGVKKYRVEFEVRVKDDGFGWSGTDVLVMAKIGKTGKYTYKVTKLNPGETLNIPKSTDPLEIQVNKQSEDLHFGLYEVWSGKWKGGLEIVRALIKPLT